MCQTQDIQETDVRYPVDDGYLNIEEGSAHPKLFIF